MFKWNHIVIQCNILSKAPDQRHPKLVMKFDSPGYKGDVMTLFAAVATVISS